ncbi:amidohydrolase [Caproicibacter fermentans]|uniref:Amidohydrolase n=1 Tax=Caproicibacter fermentans TaxID=2576756 RepID=A0A7G8T922_9FIRM|nr:amidohydrolase [Caproicibacter fermentans]QNK40113.1 amidohydrolase [Caproicibacter fermentans]
MVIKELAEQYDAFIIEKRRAYHQHPELSWKEENTTQSIQADLEAMGIETKRFDGKTGVVGLIRGGAPGKTVMLRADIDALPIEEHADVPFRSQNQGVMHACGHDCHIAMLLGAAKILSAVRQELHGNVKLIFQAAEETCHGAEYYVQQGLLDGVDAIMGMHIWGTLDAPKINVQQGGRMASCDNFKIVVRGKACHGSAPHMGTDAIVAAASVIMNLQTFASRRNDPLNPLVISIGTVHGGNAFNIIADRVEMEGTIRTYSRELRKNIETMMREIIVNTAKACGAEASLEYWQFPGPIINEQENLNRIAKNAAVKLYGESGTAPLEKMTGSEDFAYFMEKIPGIYAFIGCRNPEIGATYGNHSDKFKVDETALHRGAAFYAQFAKDFLDEK